MVINYQKFPILQALEQNIFNEKCNILATLDLQEDIKDFSQVIDSLTKHWGEIAYNTRSNITFVSKPYIECMKRSWKSFSSINLRESIKESSGVLVFKADLSGKYISVIYDITDIEKMMVVVLYECDTLYSFMIGSYFNPKMVVTNDEKARAMESKENACMGIVNTVICYLLMERYAAVETITCAKQSKIKNVGIEDKKTINYTNLDLNFRNCTWFTSICRNEGFKVRGHFRLQPKKINGEWSKELIYINEFEKNGYHRQAKILTTIETENQLSV